MSDCLYPINYDFGSNWDKVIPYLDNQKVKNAIKRGINGYLKSKNAIVKYINNTAPASYGTDRYDMLMDRVEVKYINKLRKYSDLSERFIELHKKYGNRFEGCRSDDESMDFFDKHVEFQNDYDEYMTLKEDVVKPIYEWNYIRYKLETYYTQHMCHWINPTFMFKLAKLVEPDEKWFVRQGVEHTTVINAEQSKVFDLQYWCIDSRLENYLFGDKLENIDATMGGRMAFENSG